MSTSQTSSTKAAPAQSAGIPTGKIVIKRTIPATVDEVFDAWLDADALSQWMLPGDHRRNTVSVDPRVGGAYEIIMHHQDGDKRHYGEYRGIERNKKLVFTWFSNATHHTETLVTVEFIAANDSTQLVLTHERLPDHESGLGHTRGWTRGLELLAAHFKR